MSSTPTSDPSGSSGSSGSLPEPLENYLSTLELLEDRNDRIEALIAVADRFREVPPEIATRPFPETNRAPACESEAFVFAEDQPDGTLRLHFAVENPQGISAKALAAILDQTVSGLPPEELATLPKDVVYRIFGRELSMGKSMGLMGMVGLVRGLARKRLAAS